MQLRLINPRQILREYLTDDPAKRMMIPFEWVIAGMIVYYLLFV